MEDAELAKIRQQRMAQLQKAQGMNLNGQQGGDGEGQQQQQEAKAKEAEMRNNILSQVLTQEARARLSTLRAAKPERAQMVENIIIQNTRMGVIRAKVDEEALKDLLGRINETKRETQVKYERRRVFDDDEDDDDDS